MNAGERLQQNLERFFALRQHGDDAPFLARLQRLQAWQRQRLTHTHQALLNHTDSAPALLFLLDDVYGGRDLLPVAQEIHRALPKAMKILPTRVMLTSANALEAALLCQQLDEAMVHTLAERLDHPLDRDTYAHAYRLLGREDQRRQQLQLIAQLGRHLDRHVRSRAIQTTFRLVRKPAHAAGFANLYDFMDRSFRVMKPIPSLARLLEGITDREAGIMARLLAGHPDPFKDHPHE